MPEAVDANIDDVPDFWWIGPDENPILVENAEAVLPHLPYFLAGWDIKWAGTAHNRSADIRVIEQPDGHYNVVSSGPGGADFSFDNPYDAANGLAGALISVHIAGNPNMICLHAGAARVGNGLVIVLGDSFAGKSSVALHLAVLGHRFFSDDQIGVAIDNPSHGMCLGLMPKVRLPLPVDCGDAFCQFIDGYSAMQGDGLAYLKLWDGEAGTFGETAPVRALVFLDRVEAGSTELRVASRPELVKSMISTAFAPHISSSDLLAGLNKLAEGTEAYHLCFESSREAASLLSQKFQSTNNQ